MWFKSGSRGDEPKPVPTPLDRQLQQTQRQLRPWLRLQLIASLLAVPQALALGQALGQVATAAAWSEIGTSAALVVLFGLSRAVLETWAATVTLARARAGLSQLRSQLLDHLAQASPKAPKPLAVGDISATLAEQAELLIPWLTRYTLAQTKSAAVPLVIAGVVAFYSWLAALLLLLAAPLIPIFMALIGYRARAIAERQLDEVGNLNGFLLDRLAGLRTLRLLRAIDLTAGHLREAAVRVHQRTMAVLGVAFLSSAVLELFAALGIAMVAIFVGFSLLGTFTFGTYGVQLSLTSGLCLLLLAPEFFQPLRDFSIAFHDRASAMAALTRLRQLAEPPAWSLVAPARVLPPRRASAAGVALSFEGVSFHYRTDGPAVIEACTFDLPAGGSLAVTGSSGAGKSTVLALAAGLMPPASGTITIDGQPLAEVLARPDGPRLVWLDQAPPRYPGSIRRNLTLGTPVSDDQPLWAALAAVGLDGVVARLPRGLDTPLGEGGLGLSGGEMRRLMVARALLAEADLVLADEPTAHLDAATAAIVTEALVQLGRARTLLVATHDPELTARLGGELAIAPRSPLVALTEDVPAKGIAPEMVV